MNVFARHVADGLSLADAYRAAFNTSSMKAKTVRDDASRLAQHSGVRAAINGHRAEIEARNRMFALERSERIWERLWQLIEGESVPPAVKVKALELSARLAGMFHAPKEEVALTALQVEAELSQRLRGFETPVNGEWNSPVQP
jgi:prophage tail gpP-like protein